MPRCEAIAFTDEGPHEGCKEFAPPIDVPCRKSAWWVLVLKHERGPWNPRKSRSVWKVCDEHRDEILEAIATGEDPGTTVHKQMVLRGATPHGRKAEQILMETAQDLT